MRIDTAGHAFDVTPAMRRYCELRATDAVSHLEPLVEILAVRIIGPGAGDAGVRCRMVAHVLDGPPVCIEAIDAEAHVAVDRAAARLAEGLAARSFGPLVAVRRVRGARGGGRERRGFVSLAAVFGTRGGAVRRPA